jgi:hypothetical protein
MDLDIAMHLAFRPLPLKAVEVRDRILGDAIKEHPLHLIIRLFLIDIVHHAEAIHRIGKIRAMLLHVRHIEEVYTVATYLMRGEGQTSRTCLALG